MLSCYPGQEDFPVSQVTFHSHLGPNQVFCQLKLMRKIKETTRKICPGLRNLRAACPNGKLEFNLFSSPVSALDNKAFKHD